MRPCAEMVRRTRSQVRRMLVRVRAQVPPGLRFLVGLVLIAGGVLGFLPILGFWMIPLGIAVAALDVAALRRWWMRRNSGN